MNLISNEEALSVLQRSRNNRRLFDDGERIAWVADDAGSSDKTEGATVKFLLFTKYPTASAPEDSVKISLKPDQLGVNGAWEVRDLWGMKDLGELGNGISLYVRNHGAALLRMRETK